MTALADILVPGEWVTDALCGQIDPDEWFPDKGGTSRHAKSVCGSCLVRAECLQQALDNDERFGIWGGFSERERRKLSADPEARAAAFASIAATTPTAPTIPTYALDPRKDQTMTLIDTRCRWCRDPYPTAELVDDLCGDCTRKAAEAPKTTPSVGGVNATPATVLHSGGRGAKDAQQAVILSTAGDTCAPDENHPLAGCPDYIVQIAIVMRDSEGHPDQKVRAARKAVVGTLQILHKALAAAVTSDLDVLRAQGLSNADILDRELQAVEKRGTAKKKPTVTKAASAGKRTPPNNSLAIAGRVAALGVTTRDIRAWATSAGIDVPSRGALPVRVVDAYEAAHTAAAS